MPAELEKKLKKEAIKKALTPECRDAYIYGTMRKMVWKPSAPTTTSSTRG